MAPTPQNVATLQDEALAVDNDRIVISGMSGIYPESCHIKDLSKILYEKKNPISNVRWRFNHPEVPQYSGKVTGLEDFDAQFFKVHYRLSHTMDPMNRKLLEQTYNAIYDAGVNPNQLSEKKIGVFIGVSLFEGDKSYYYTRSVNGLAITGFSRAMLANRISYYLNAKGPSMSIDEACCSSTAALEHAYKAIRRGDCESAIVGGCHLCMHPQSSVHYARMMKQAGDGKTKSFDKNADGTVISEAINILFLQKAKDAFRVYADLIHVKTEFVGYREKKDEFSFIRDPITNVNFMKNFYAEAKISPQSVEYVEALGCADSEVDRAELEAIDEVFCKDKKNTLLVGSVTSNIGYVAPASGILAITKVLLGYHTGVLAANLHCENPRQDVEALREGRMKIVTEHQTFGRTYAAVNGLSFNGVNSHLLLKGYNKPKDLSQYQTNIPHLVILSARKESFVKDIIDSLKSRPIDHEELALLHNIHQSNISGHLGRGYVILGTDRDQKAISLAEHIEYFDKAKRPLWFVYSGMGSQWAGMGAQLMRIPIFAAAIERCRQALEPKGINIVHLITANDDKIYDNILHSFVGIAAVQIGLTDVLRELGLVPDGIIGHSVGELGCAYADGCLTAEEMILSAYNRGLVSLQTPFIRGSMAAVGLGYDKVSKIIPPEIEVACHNGPESSTISGPYDIMREFVAELTAKGIFAKEVPCSNIAYHSSYIAEAGPSFLEYLKNVIKTPKRRSHRWVSTSVPKDSWNKEWSQYSSAEYHTNNLLSPVLFEETLPEVPRNAVLVEVAPHGLLQAILKRSLPNDCKNIALTLRKHPDNTFLLLDAVGKLFMEGYNPKVHALYPKVKMPVSTGTPFLSHYVQWAHEERWSIPVYHPSRKIMTGSCKYLISLHDTENNYLKGNIIREKTLYPFAAALVAVWDTFAMSMNVPKKELSVQFRKLQFYTQPVIQEQKVLTITVNIQRGSGSFEVLDENIKVATGCVVTVKTKNTNKIEVPNQEAAEEMILTATDIYSLFQGRDYFYSGEFQTIIRANLSLTEAELAWRNNWITFIDGLLQLNALRQPHDTVSKLTHVRELSININKHYRELYAVSRNNMLLKAEVNDKYDFTICGGISIKGIRHEVMPISTNKNMELQALQFIKNKHSGLDIATSLLVFLQIIAENLNKNQLHIIGLNQISNNRGQKSIFEILENIKPNVNGIKIKYEHIQQQLTTTIKKKLEKADAVILYNLSIDNNICEHLHHTLQPDTFIISEEDQMIANRDCPTSLYRVLTTISGKDKTSSILQLIRWKPTPTLPVTTTVTINSPTDYSLLSSTCANLPLNNRLLVFSPYPAPTGLKKLIQICKKEIDHNSIYLIMSNDERNNLSIDELPEIYLAFNVVEKGEWGGEYYLPIQEVTSKTNNVMLKTSCVGDYEFLTWTAAPETLKNGVKVNVHYAGINDIDVSKANGTILFEKYKDNCFGLDFSGTTASGERVMGIVLDGAIRTQVTANPELLWPVPAHWSLEEAATVPIAYIQALYCLVIKGELAPGQRILIHDGCEAVGQAAIAIALYLNCEVFITVSDISKKQFLRKLFPKIKENYIGNSCDETFADMIQIETRGKGCKVVLNNLKQDLKNVSFRCGGYGSKILDITLHNPNEKFEFGLRNLLKSRSYWFMDLSDIFKNENQEELRVLQGMLSDGITTGFVRPLSRVTYAPKDIVRAFRMLAANRHRGRILIHMQDDTLVIKKNRLTCNSELSQVIFNFNEDEFALHLGDRLVDRGAKKLHIHQTAYSKSKYIFKIRSWQNSGVRVQTTHNTLSTENAIEDILNEANKLGPIQDIYAILGAGDNVHESFFTALDLASRRLCPSLRHFLVLNLSDNTNGYSTCYSRAGSNLSATMLCLPEYNNVRTKITWREVLTVLERALHASGTTFIAHLGSEQKLKLSEQIARLGGIPMSKLTSMTDSLEQLGVNHDNLNIIGNFLKAVYNVTLDEKQLSQLTIETLLRLEDSNCITAQEASSLEIFISQIELDEIQATTDIVFLPTIGNEETSTGDEYDVSQAHMYIVPGIEGLYSRFRKLCARLKIPAIALQPGLGRPQETIPETAKRFAELLLSKTGLKGNFNLLGYESGVFVALEIARILEEYGLTGTVYCLGSAPGELQGIIEEHLSEYRTEKQLQDAVVHHIFKLMGGKDTVGLDKELQKAVTWPHKVNVCVQFLKGHMSHSNEYTTAVIESALGRIDQVRRYNAAPHPLHSSLILLRAATSHRDLDVASLQRYSHQPVVVHQLTTPLSQVSEDIRCASIINESLDPEVLSEFEKKNICDTYVLPDSIYVSISDEEE